MTRKGRRPIYETPEQLQAAVDQYFETCKGVPAYDKNGIPFTKRNGQQYYVAEVPPTLTGLALFCGYKNRETFMRQKSRSAAFCDVVLVAHSRIEDFYEQALMDANTFSGAAFMLSVAFGWKQRKAKKHDTAKKVVILNRPAEPKKAVQGDGSAAHDLQIDLQRDRNRYTTRSVAGDPNVTVDPGAVHGPTGA